MNNAGKVYLYLKNQMAGNSQCLVILQQQNVYFVTPKSFILTKEVETEFIAKSTAMAQTEI